MDNYFLCFHVVAKETEEIDSAVLYAEGGSVEGMRAVQVQGWEPATHNVEYLHFYYFSFVLRTNLLYVYSKFIERQQWENT